MASKQRGSGFVGLDRYLEANRAGAQAMADKLGGGVQSTGGAAQAGLNDAWQKFNTGVQGGSLAFDPTNLTSAQAMERAGKVYTGPGSISEMAGFDAAREQADRAAQQAAGLTSFNGRQVALQDAYGKQGGYNPGQQRLDSFLSGAAGGGRFQQLKDQYGSLSQQFGADNTKSQQQAQQASAATQQAAAKYGQAAPALRAAEEAEAKRKADELRAGIDSYNQGTRRRNVEARRDRHAP